MKQMHLKVRDGLIASAMVGLLMAGWSVSTSAQTTCTTANWTNVVGLVNGDSNATGDVGTPPAFRRYAGPCALKVPVNGVARYVTDESPNAETSYIARFYVFLDFSASATITLFEALDASDAPQLRLQYSGRDMALEVFNNSSTQSIQFTGLTNGWNSVEVAWTQAAEAEVSFSLNGNTPETVTVDTAGRFIDKARMGNVNGATVASANIDFDDFDSRRQTRPGRLLRGDATGDNVVNIFDVQAAGSETFQGVIAPGQPDCNEDGVINIFDVQCIGAIVFN